MRFLAIAFFLCLLASCAGSKSYSEHSGKNLHQILEEVSCPNTNDFRAAGVGGNESEALAQARSNMALEHFSQKLKSNIQISGQNINSVASSSAFINIDQEATLLNSQDAKLYHSKRHGEQIGVVACMSRADAAKGFMEQQRLIADSLELVSHSLLATEHPKQKNETWRRIQMLWNGFSRNEKLLNEWNAASPKYLLDSLNETYSKARDDYKNYCQKTKLHWNAEHENLYSNIAFSRLSQNLKMEKSVCKENGISLVYKHTEPDCSYKFGIYNCAYKPSLSVGSCEGIKYFLLENFAERTHQKQEFSLEKLQDSLKTIDFWKKWEQEIKEWSPQCE
ncbi:MAG: hypothetical protein FWH22_11235 [Fibromonadales bacterium]|nr:hypothetical protein [Fibromonadales bacterium]